ncbi:MAG TPA: class I SAM-dependent methyltransferase [Casimicrobiaceae bacterium]
MIPHAKASSTERHRWERAIAPLLQAPADALWRAHSDAVNAGLLARWLPAETALRALKTDLFDEAMGDGLYPLLEARARHVAALDLAPSALAAAVSRYPKLLATSADVRRLPFASATFDIVVSNSTLDHFESHDEIIAALRELHRVLRRHGHLLLTMDNLANPVIAIRNALPFRLLHRMGLVPYTVGVTWGPRRMRRMLAQLGFEVLETEALLHCPRVLAVPLARRIQRRADAGSQARFLRRLRRWECLAALPTRFLTGYFIGVSARKK